MANAEKKLLLTAKQQQFVREYLVDLNASDAARRAGYSKRTAEQQGYQLLRSRRLRLQLPRHKPNALNGPRSPPIRSSPSSPGSALRICSTS
jgi:hypothetical protein